MGLGILVHKMRITLSTPPAPQGIVRIPGVFLTPPSGPQAWPWALPSWPNLQGGLEVMLEVWAHLPGFLTWGHTVGTTEWG